ncbi:DUF2178 domain-containing protein [Natronococcus sp. A-GB7]|uniref:DUF2178 domain-containing protein n=1 Tax=Natronococcus sp. A-GB7 TaxID=3037649 RepID=UPI00241F7A02|nr:DUF2178 domain-containing protein [Natronococcus sp. A-GB7]MDG5818970.1 DUF2178 domain-containing protein [Natronococcus sp. A-GB7]
MSELASTNIQSRPPEAYKRLMVACFVFAGIALGVGTALEFPLVAVGLYVLGMAGGMMIPYTTNYTLFDERDDTIHQRASGVTLAVFGWLAAIVFPSLVALSTTPHFEWGPVTMTLSITTAVVYITYGLLLGYYR